MADALLSIVLEELASVVKQEVKLVLSVRNDVKDLSAKLEIVKAVLHDAEIKQFKEKAVKLLMEQLIDVLYVADDVLDEWNTRINLNSSQIQGVHNDDDGVSFRKKVFSYFLCPCLSFKSVVVDYGFGTRIKEIRERFDEITKNKEFLLLNQGQSHEEPHQRLTSSIVDVSEICGRDHDKKVIISKLLSESSHQDLNTDVISIVGTGGFGKTTLAKLVLEEEEVKKTFEKTMWVCVSEPFNLIEVAKKIIKQAVGNVPTFTGWEDLHPCLCNSIKGSRFLLVLDDVWTEDSNDWDPLKLSLNGGARGSRIIVTTRSENVAQMMGSSHNHILEKLSVVDSWSLFKRITFTGRQEDLAKLENIGMEICKKCKGVPLAIKIVASLMRYKKTKKEWRNVLGSEIWDIQQIQKDFLPSLFLSYYPLPSVLKQCFMYCAIFQKDSELEKDQLVKLWMAQGFLGSGGDKDLEKSGEEYFDDLAMRSFFQISERDLEGNISICMMHDLVHDFAQFLAKEECCILERGKKLSDDSKVRHIGNYFLEGEDCSTIYKAKNLRTLWASTSINLTRVFNEMKFLRVLDLRRNDFEQLPDEIERLLHLRYLDLSETELLELPKTICFLYQLQTLKLNGCENLVKLPDGIVELINLRHLELEGTYALRCIPQGFGRLKFLRTLCKFFVGDASTGCDISELQNLCFLQGSLAIEGLGRVADAKKAAQAELKKKRLDVLSLNFDNSEGDIDNMSLVLENLQPHEDVQELNIVGFAGFQFPSWIPNSSMSINLVKLRLEECERTTELPALGNLESLEELNIRALSSVKHIGTQFCGFGVAAFPKLKKLVISRMLELIEWELPVSTKIMPCLQKLKLSDCPMLRALPSFGRLESLESLEISKLHSIIRVGSEFFGISGDEFGGSSIEERVNGGGGGGGELIQEQEEERASCSRRQLVISFPKLKKLVISRMLELIEWELPVSTKIMPCLQELELSDCPKLRALPGLGRLESLESLEISKLHSIIRVGSEFFGISGDEFGGSFIEERVNGGGGGGGELIQEQEEERASCSRRQLVISFPKLKKLVISRMLELIEWELPVSTKIMPCLQELELSDCPKLRALPGLGRLESLESLKISKLHSIIRVGPEFFGISGDEFGGSSIEERVNGGGGGELIQEQEEEEEERTSCSRRQLVISFPKLTELKIEDMKEWEEWNMPQFLEDAQIITIMPCLRELYFYTCPKLEGILPDILTRFKSLEILRLLGLIKCEEREDISLPTCLRVLRLYECEFDVIPSFLFPPTLRKLVISNCKNLGGMQPCLPPLLEELVLFNDVGVLSESLPIGDGEELSHNYLNLQSFKIYSSKHPSLPKGFNHLTAIQYLDFFECESLDFDLNELKHFTKLQKLFIDSCPILAKRFQSSGDDWMTILSHVPNITIDYENIKGSYY